MKQVKNTDKLLYSILNGRQLAIKVSMNSLYGFCGAAHGFLGCKPIAESITAKGRELILFAKDHVETKYNAVVVYGDSDSIYVQFEATSSMTMNTLFELSTECQNWLNTLFQHPVEIEFEKVYFPFILFTKKRYCALVWETPDETQRHVEYKGISIVRRDFCRFTRETLTDVLNCVLYDRNIEAAHERLFQHLNDLLSGRIDSSKLIMSKSLSATYKKMGNDNVMPHVRLTQRMKERDPNNYPKSGERVPFIYIINEKRLTCERVESPEYVQEHQLSIDLLYYIQHQVYPSCEELFNVLLAPHKFDLNVDNALRMKIKSLEQYQQTINRKYKNKSQGQKEITSFFKK